MRRLAVVVALLLATCAAARAQSNPAWTFHFVPSAAQWNAAFAGKQDVLGFSPLNTAGGTMTGLLSTFPSALTGAGLNVGVGVAPSSPSNGDIWATSTGLFFQFNGVTAKVGTFTPEVTVAFSATPTFDFTTFRNAIITLTANITTMNVAGVVPGQRGRIRYQQSGAGSFTTVFNSIFKFPGGTVPVLTLGSATAIDVLEYDCQTATFCTSRLDKDVR
jgi:hypothetical protein